MSKITTNSIGFQLLKIRFFGFFGLGARSEIKAVNEVMAELRVEKHPDKTFIGRIA
ncbi:MAG: hypothetical protein F6K47_42340 [Symploca sp. SIO2E6]|nr:hypothetical protein [Symploca sp. SIO2E6]